jgi:AraC-like DNA-binding protein
MDININEALANALVVYANYAPFHPGKKHSNGPVQSRMLVWCKAGRGTITANGVAYDFQPGNFLFLPWNHYIRYQAAARNPFLLAGIHIIPDYRKSGEILYRAFHSHQPNEREYNKRKDVFLKDFTDAFYGRVYGDSPLLLLAEYIVLWFRREPRTEDMARSLAKDLLNELEYVRLHRKNADPCLAPSLSKVLRFIEANIDAPVDISVLAEKAGCSRPTLFRLFRKHLSCTPGNWFWRKKMEYAADLLTKSNMRVGEIAGEIGMDDPYYFSKLFKKYCGKTAGKYRSDNSLTSRQ